MLWNSGKKRIYREDIIDDIFQINIRDPYKILHAKVIYTNIDSQNIDNQFMIPPEEKSLSLFQIIEFSCLKPGEGAVIEITHTGKYSKGIKVSGELREHGEIQNADKGIGICYIDLLALIIYGIAASILVQIFLHYFNLYASKLDGFWRSIVVLITLLPMLTLYLYCSLKNSPFYRFLKRNMLSISKDLDDAFNNDNN